MKKTLLAAVLLAAVAAMPAAAQVAPSHAYCGTAHRLDRADLEAFAAARAAGTLPRDAARKGMSPPEIGETAVFNVQESNAWNPLTFTLMDKTDAYLLWVENGQLDEGNVSDTEIAGLRAAMFETTPSASFDPTEGILANNHTVFGRPPNFDGDGLVDILLYDIGGGTATTTTLGYVSSSDVNPNAQEGVGNQADVLYLDANEGTRNLETLAVIAAHEYTHLIHLAYNLLDEQTFISEGLAEYAMVMNGYFWRPINYIGSASEYGLPLFTWRNGGGPNAWDYERAGLFFTYIASRVGPRTTGALLRTDLDDDGDGPDIDFKGSAGLEAVLDTEGLTLAEVIADFHLANFINDAGLDPIFAYPQPQRQSVRAPLTRVFDGKAFTAIEGDTTLVDSGSIQYTAFIDVADLTLNLDVFAANIFLEIQRARLRPHVLLEYRDGRVALETFEAGPTSVTFRGNFDRVVLMVPHIEPEVQPGVKIILSGSWKHEADPVPVEADPTLPAALTLAPNYPNPFNPSTEIGFALPRAGHVRLAVYDALGREVAVLLDAAVPAGPHSASFDAAGLPSGLYLAVLTADGQRRTRTLTLVK